MFQIESTKQLSLIKSRIVNRIGLKTLSQINSRKVSQIKSETVTRKIADADDRVCGGGSDAEIGGLITRRCDHSNLNGGVGAGTLDIDADVVYSLDEQNYM